MSLIRKIKTLGWLLKNLSLLPQLADDVKNIKEMIAKISISSPPVTQNILTILTQWQRANLCNQISLANKAAGKRTIYSPWEKRKSFFLEFNEKGQLCFLANGNPASNPRRIFVNTIPKSGTYFLGAILAEMGIIGIPIHALTNNYADERGLPPGNVAKFISLPLASQIPLMQPNQFLLAHIENYESSFLGEWMFQKNDVILLTIRDLRHCILSYMRHLDSDVDVEGHITVFTPCVNYSSDDMYDFLKSKKCNDIFNTARCHLALMESQHKIFLIRYEELMSSDRDVMLPSMEALSSALGCSVSEVIRAVEKKRDTKTATFTGDHVKLDAIWTDKVEELFIAKGGDILNEKLGYAREYTPGQ